MFLSHLQICQKPNKEQKSNVSYQKSNGTSFSFNFMPHSLPAVSPLQWLCSIAATLSAHLAKHIFPVQKNHHISTITTIGCDIYQKEQVKPTSSSFVLMVMLLSSEQDFSIESFDFSNSVVKVCTWDSWRSRSSLTCCSSTRSDPTSLAKASFCFVASSWED